MFWCTKVLDDPCTLVFFTDVDLDERKELEQLLTEKIGVKCVVLDMVERFVLEDGLQDRPIVFSQHTENKCDDRYDNLRHRYLILEALLGFVCGFLIALLLGF